MSCSNFLGYFNDHSLIALQKAPPFFLPRQPFEMRRRRRSCWLFYGILAKKSRMKELCKNIATRFWEWLSEILRHSALLGRAVEHFEIVSWNLAGMFLHDSVVCTRLLGVFILSGSGGMMGWKIVSPYLNPQNCSLPTVRNGHRVHIANIGSRDFWKKEVVDGRGIFVQHYSSRLSQCFVTVVAKSC